MDTRHRARLVIADDHTLVAEACRRLLEPEFEVVAVVNNGRALLEVGSELKPDVALVDIAMPRLNGLDASEELKRLVPFTKIVILTMSLDAQLAAEAFRRGASAYVVKNAAVEELLTAIREVLKGQLFLSPLITEDTVHVLLRNGNRPDSDKRITNALNVKPGTVAFHKYRAMESLGLKTNSDLLRYAIAHHMIS